LDVADPGAWLVLAAGTRLASIAAALATRGRPGLCRASAFGGSAAASLVTGGVGLFALAAAAALRGPLIQHDASGLALGCSVDALSGWFLVVLGLVGTAVAVYSVGYFAHASPGRTAFVGVAFNVLLGSVEMVFVAAGAIGFLLAWELMTLATAALVATEHEHAQTRRAAFLYLALSHLGTGCLVAGFLLLASHAPSLAFADILGRGSPAIPLPSVVFLLFLAGFGVKAGMIPLHVWLPEAHPAAPSPISALMSGVLIKTGIYGIFRVCVAGLGVPPLAWGGLVLALGAVSMVLGVLYALMQHDLKRLLAYHSIENIGIILIALGSAILLESHGAHELAALALAAAIFHSINHALFKTLLFLGAGAVLHATGLRDLNHLGGLGRRMPVTMLAFMIGAAAISGLPPLNGFASEWLTFQGLLATAGGHDIAPIARFAAAGTIGALALTTGLAVACFVKATGIAFLGLPRSAAAAAAQEVARPALAAMAALAAACVATGLAAGPAFHALLGVARVSLHSASGPAGPIPSTFTPAVTAGPHTDFAATYTPLAVGLLLILAVGIVALAARYRILLAARRVERIAEPRRVDTWACGIAPRAAFQYNATSYSKPVRIFFRRIFSPEREVRIEYHPGTAFPSSISYRSHVTLVVEDRIWRPLHALSLRAANFARKLQGGAIQIYIAYCVIAVLLLLAWARWS